MAGQLKSGCEWWQLLFTCRGALASELLVPLPDLCPKPAHGIFVDRYLSQQAGMFWVGSEETIKCPQVLQTPLHVFLSLYEASKYQCFFEILPREVLQIRKTHRMASWSLHLCYIFWPPRRDGPHVLPHSCGPGVVCPAAVVRTVDRPVLLAPAEGPEQASQLCSTGPLPGDNHWLICKVRDTTKMMTIHFCLFVSGLLITEMWQSSACFMLSDWPCPPQCPAQTWNADPLGGRSAVLQRPVPHLWWWWWSG